MTHPVYAAARVMAWFGALVLTLLALMSVVSIAGRALSGLGLGPVPGDFELVEAGTALAVFCFLPWAHLKRGHAVVDLFWRAYPPALQRLLDVAADLLMLGVWLLLVWRMGVAMHDYRGNAKSPSSCSSRCGGAMRRRWCRPRWAAWSMPGAWRNPWAW